MSYVLSSLFQWYLTWNCGYSAKFRNSQGGVPSHAVPFSPYQICQSNHHVQMCQLSFCFIDHSFLTCSGNCAAMINTAIVFLSQKHGTSLSRTRDRRFVIRNKEKAISFVIILWKKSDCGNCVQHYRPALYVSRVIEIGLSDCCDDRPFYRCHRCCHSH